MRPRLLVATVEARVGQDALVHTDGPGHLRVLYLPAAWFRGGAEVGSRWRLEYQTGPSSGLWRPVERLA